ncbi:hypothetical protein JHD50_03880 [Sulfurimonas sp. MAG313]|nr:hypothetical protein [Sulfurimonas sp. MAG313]MDF1880450.1 hypothetical protein [Sulfurimonas sp. MAG313]
MKINIYFILVLLTSLLVANEPLIQKKKVPLTIALPLLKSIEQYSILVGSGPTQMYAFIDPICPRSRDFVEMVLDNKNMQKLYTYHFFLFELKRFHSSSYIAEILNSSHSIELMKKVMVKKEKIQGLDKIPNNIQKKMNLITNIAEQLDINKRPYLFVVKPNKEDN